MNFFPRFLILLLLAASPVVAAPSLSGSGSQSASPDGSRPQSTRVDFFELMESAGEAFLDLFRSERQRGTLENPKWDGTDSPRTTVMTFIEAMDHVAQGREEALDRALQTFPDDLGTLDREAAARHLLEIFDRLPEITASSIPGEDIVANRGITRYELFPRGLDNSFLYKVLEQEPRGSIVLEKGDDGWHFTRETVSGANEFLESIARIPPRPRIERRGNLFLNTVQPTFTQTGWGDWLRFVLWLGGSILLAWLAVRLFTKGADRLRATSDFVVGPLLSSLRAPSAIVIVLVGLMIGTASIHFEPALSRLRWMLLEAFSILALIWLVVSLLELAVVGIQRLVSGRENPYARMLSTVIRRMVRIAALVLIAIFIIQNVFQWNVTALLGGLGILALAISLAAKDAVANLFGSLTIFANQPFVSGDWIRFQGRLGEVEDVSVQVTRIRLLEGDLWSVPNMCFVDTAVENLSMRRYIRRVMSLAIPYGTPPEKTRRAIEILEEIFRSEEIVGAGDSDPEERPPWVNFTEFDDYSLNIRIDYWYLMSPSGTEKQRDTERGYKSYLDHKTKVNLTIAERFATEGISFAYPTRTIELKDGRE